MDGGSCHWEPVPREGKFLQPVESPAEPHPFTSCSWAAWDICLQGGFIELAERLVVLISLFSLSLSQCFLLCGSSPRGSKHRADPDQQHSPGQFFLLCFPLSRRDSTQIQSCCLLLLSSFILPILFPIAAFLFPSPHQAFITSLCSFPAPEHSVPGSAWAGIFYHPALFCIHALISTFCSFWIPVAPAGINHWSRNSALEHRFPVKGCW